MFSSRNLALNRTGRELFKEITRQISKTSSVPNSDTISRQENKLGVNNLELKSSGNRTLSNKWSSHSRHNNIRALSTIQTKVKPSVSNAPLFSKEECRDFLAVFPDIVRDLTDAGRHTDIPEVTKRFAKVLQYNVPNGKKTRGLTTVISYKMLEKPENLTPENIRLANILGWCVELLRALGVVVDDLVDNSETRNDQLCCYKGSDLGHVILDSMMLEKAVFSVLRKHFSTHPHYVLLVELFHDIALKGALGKILDGEINNGGSVDLSKITMKNYRLISEYRNGYYSLQLPVALAMYLAQMTDPEQHRQAKTILQELCRYFQVQKDFQNCFDDSNKSHSDINEGKCSWLAVVALQRANPTQRKIMETYYGKSGKEAVDVIKELYIELGLPATYEKHEEQTYKIINTHIQQITRGLPHKLFFTLLHELDTYH